MEPDCSPQALAAAFTAFVSAVPELPNSMVSFAGGRLLGLEPADPDPLDSAGALADSDPLAVPADVAALVGSWAPRWSMRKSMRRSWRPRLRCCPGWRCRTSRIRQRRAGRLWPARSASRICGKGRTSAALLVESERGLPGWGRPEPVGGTATDDQPWRQEDLAVGSRPAIARPGCRPTAGRTPARPRPAVVRSRTAQPRGRCRCRRSRQLPRRHPGRRPRAESSASAPRARESETQTRAVGAQRSRSAAAERRPSRHVVPAAAGFRRR